jgi:pyruvate-formate lyase-activating enzyme
MPPMGAVHYKTLVLETGVLCNNRCTFCYQRGYRGLPGYPKLVPGEELLSRMRWGIANGYDEVSLTGGEPTIRPDFLDLVRQARELGYRRVAITTNGWRLADPDFFAQAVQAGLTSLGVSIHGATAEVHDRVVGHPGAFARAVRALHHAVRTHGGARPVRVNTFTVVHRGNADQLPQMAEILHALGVRLMIFQPAILSKSNFHEAAATRVDLEGVVAAIRSVAMLGMERGFRVKLFNLPPCLFRDVLPGLDLDPYERATFREHDQDAAGDESRGEEVGFVRLLACDGCVLKSSCPGIHVTLMPQEDLASHFEEAVASISAHQHAQIWLAGTDLMRGAALARVVRKARLAGFQDVRVTVGGSGIAGRATYVAARQGGATGVVLVHHARDPQSSDRILCHQGNDLFLIEALADLATVPLDDALDVGLLVSPDDAAIALLQRVEVASVLSRIPYTLMLRAPWRHSQAPTLHLRQLRAFLSRVDRLDCRPRAVVLATPWPRIWEAALALPAAAAATGGALRFDLTPTVLPTSFLDPRYSVLNWSLPHLGGMVLDDATRTPLRVRDLVARSVRARAITREALLAARTTYGGGPGGPSTRPPRPGEPRPSPARGP